MEVFKLLGKIVLDNSGAMTGMDDTVTKAKKTESNLTKIFKKVGTIVASAFAVDKIKEFGIACKDAYAEVAAEQSAFAQIMGDYASEAQEKLDEVAAKTGAVATRMTPYMTSLTAKFKGLGYGIDEATDLASQGLNMAADAAAFWDMSLEDSMSHLNSFINGSYEGGEAIGLFANDTQMAAYAIEKGLVTTTAAWSALDEATKQATRLEYAQNMMNMSGATGQAAKESKSLANVQANLTESWRQFLAVVGEPIVNNLVIPAMEKLNEIMPKVTEATKKGIEWIGNAFNTVKESVKDVPGLLSSAGQTISDTWTNKIYPAIRDAFKIVFGIDLPEWSELKASIVDWWEGDNGIKRGIASVCNWVLNLFGAPADVSAQDVSDVLSSWWTGAKNLVQNACNWILNLFGAPKKVTAGDVSDVMSSWWMNTKTDVQNTCDWILGLFGAPDDVTASSVSDVLSSWWTDTKNHVEDTCTWVLKKFGAPEDVTADEAKRILSDWWTSAKTHVINACEWVLQVFKEPMSLNANKVKAILKTWWDTAKGFVQSACEWALNIFGEPGEVTQFDIDKLLQPWWLKAVELVKNVCTWALNLFGAPDDLTQTDANNILDTWWGKALTLVQDTCTWVLSLFGAPSNLTESDVENIIGTWWTSAAALIEDACAWVLNLFGEPEAVSEEKVEEILGNWWTGAKALVQSACSWVLQLFTNPNESQQTIIDHVKSWWDTIGNVVAGACSWVLKLFGVPEDTVEDIQKLIQDWWDGIKTNLVNICKLFVSLFAGGTNKDGTTWVDYLKAWFQGILDSAGDVFNIAVSVVGGLLEPARNALTSWWNDVISGVTFGISPTVAGSQKGTSNVADSLKGGNGSAASASGTMGATAFAFGFDSALMDKIPGFATGLDYVPRDNYLARLHQGEAVLTREEADVWRGNGDTSRMESILNNVANLLQVIAQNTGAGTQIVLDSGALVGQLAPGLDAQLGTISSRKGRRN